MIEVMNEKILVTEKEYAKGQVVFQALQDFDVISVPNEETDLAGCVRESSARAVVVGVDSYQGPLYEALASNGAGLIARFGVGCDGIQEAPRQMVVTKVVRIKERVVMGLVPG